MSENLALQAEKTAVRKSVIITQNDTKAEPPFIKLYLQDISLLRNLPTSHIAILYELVLAMDNKNIVYITTWFKSRIAKKLNLKKETIRQNIYALCKARILEKVENMVYKINPLLFKR